MFIQPPSLWHFLQQQREANLRPRGQVRTLTGCLRTLSSCASAARLKGRRGPRPGEEPPGMPTHRKCGNGLTGAGGSAHLLHEQVDVQLGVIQHIAVRLAQALQGPLHRPAVDIDPAGSARGQELPVRGDGGQPRWVQAPQACPPPARPTSRTHWYTESTRAGIWACPP